MAYCNWGNSSPLNLKYHDEEWGVPVYDDIKQFEFLMMEVMQCGLSWNIVINKREIFRRCFDGFDYDKIADYDEKDVARIMATEGMIKSPRKINAIIHNAQCFQKIRADGRKSKHFCIISNGANGYSPLREGIPIVGCAFYTGEWLFALLHIRIKSSFFALLQIRKSPFCI